MILTGIICIFLFLFFIFVFCLLHTDAYERELSDREQEEYIRNWLQQKSKRTKDIG